MGWSATLGAWARREAVLVSCLAAAAAIAALAGLLGAAWLLIAGAIVAAAGALARVVIAVQRTRLEGERERYAAAHRLRVPVVPIDKIDPTWIGVDPAAQTILAGKEVPDYVGRPADGQVQAAVAAALAGSGRWLVVVIGASKVGKSRTLFEALRRCAPAGQLEFLAPVDGAALRALLTPGEQVGWRPAGRVVLWLDDLEPFLIQGVTLPSLPQLARRCSAYQITSTTCASAMRAAEKHVPVNGQPVGVQRLAVGVGQRRLTAAQLAADVAAEQPHLTADLSAADRARAACWTRRTSCRDPVARTQRQPSCRR